MQTSWSVSLTQHLEPLGLVQDDDVDVDDDDYDDDGYDVSGQTEHPTDQFVFTLVLLNHFWGNLKYPSPCIGLSG